MKRRSAVFLLLLSTTIFCSQATDAQAGSSRISESESQKIESIRSLENSAFNPQLALSSEYYPVTPGDMYSLAYAAGNTPVTYTILVDTSYRVRVANLALIDVRGMSFATLKERVETIISKNYPFSGVQFGLTSPAVFRVTVKGEVLKTAEQDAWSLSRLSSVVQPHLTKYSSLRDVTLTSLDGKTTSYDLFRATRFGDLSQDPLVRPGDIVTLNRVQRVVTIEGAVERPGVYQLLEGEGLYNLVSIYGNGLTPVADDTRIDLVRYIGSNYLAGEKIFLEKKDIENNFELKNYDFVTVNSITDLVPVMFMEGALGLKGLEETTVTPDASTRIPVRFNQGENYAALVRRYRSAFSAVSDTANAYVIRGDTQIPLNLNPMLYDASYRSEYLVEKDDVLIIPFRQYFVSVSGAVVSPGRYPYIPDRDWSYYVSLAGGFNNLMNSRESVTITDVRGVKHSKSDIITPETVIEANANAFLFYFNQYAPIITTTLSIVTTFITVTTLIGK